MSWNVAFCPESPRDKREKGKKEVFLLFREETMHVTRWMEKRGTLLISSRNRHTQEERERELLGCLRDKCSRKGCF